MVSSFKIFELFKYKTTEEVINQFIYYYPAKLFFAGFFLQRHLLAFSARSFAVLKN